MKRKFTFLLVFSLSLFFFNHLQAQTNTFVDFNETTDLTNYFTPASAPPTSTPPTPTSVFTNISDKGIGNTGAVNVPLESNDIWTTKSSYGITDVGSTYEMSAFFKIKANSGYGGLGFTASQSNSPDGNGSPEFGLGMCFHGGGGYFVNNRVNTSVSWPPDLAIGAWYKMILKVTAKGSNAYDLEFQIWNSDENGVLGTMKTSQTLDNVINTNIGSASEIYAYFSAAGSRMEKIDNFELTLTGATIVNLPNVTTDAVSSIISNAATLGGNVIAENGSSVTARGVCWNTTGNPNLFDNFTTDGTGTGSFTSSILNLTSNTTYYVKAYATNSIGTSYGEELTFTTLTTDMPELSEFDISIYPNPMSDKLMIEKEGYNGKINFEIFNSIGQVIFNGNFIEKTIVQTSSFAPGIYLIKLENGKTFEFKKIIKE